MFKVELHDVTNGEEKYIGYAMIDEKGAMVAEVGGEFEYDSELSDAIDGSLKEIIDLHNVMQNDPDKKDVLGVEVETSDNRTVSISLTD